MKIMIISDAGPPQINGVVTTLTNLVSCLKDRNYQVEYINPKHFVTLPFPYYPEIHIPLNPYYVFSKIYHYNPDAIHITTEGLLGFFAFLYCILYKKPYFTSYHTDWQNTLSVFEIPILGWLIKKWIKKLHNNARFTLVTNNEMKKTLTDRGYKNLVVWSRGYNENIFNSFRKRDLSFKKPILLTVSRISKEKNLEAFFNLKTSGTKVCIGDGPLLEKYTKQYPDVFFMGKKITYDLASWYAAADVFVFTSKTDTFGVVMLESIGCGTPVAAYPVTGPTEVVINGENGYMSDNLDEAVNNCIGLDRNKVYESSKKWTWDNVADIYITNLLKYF